MSLSFDVRERLRALSPESKREAITFLEAELGEVPASVEGLLRQLDQVRLGLDRSRLPESAVDLVRQARDGGGD